MDDYGGKILLIMARYCSFAAQSEPRWRAGLRPILCDVAAVSEKEPMTEEEMEVSKMTIAPNCLAVANQTS